MKGGLRGGGHAWRGACVARGMRGGGACMAVGVRGRYHEIRSMSGRYASYWNAFLFYSNKIKFLNNVCGRQFKLVP